MIFMVISYRNNILDIYYMKYSIKTLWSGKFFNVATRKLEITHMTHSCDSFYILHNIGQKCVPFNYYFNNFWIFCGV